MHSTALMNVHKCTNLNPRTAESCLHFPNIQKVSPGKWMSNQHKMKEVLSPQLLISNLVSTCQKHITSCITHPLPPYVDPNAVFTGNLTPVDELEPTSCPVVEGELPLCLNGVYIRNGPNPQHMSTAPLHLLEGDGMLHSLRLSGGQATYCCRFVKTYKYMLEQEAGFPIFPNVLSGFHSLKDVFGFVVFIFRVLSGHINPMTGFGSASTALAFFSGKLLALNEADLPYAINVTKEGDIHTIGRWEFEKSKLLANITAHPKIDPDTKEAFAYRYGPLFPYFTYFWFDQDGIKKHEVPLLSINKPTPIHDFAITKRFAIFLDTQLVLEPLRMILGRGMPVSFEADKVARVGIIPKYARDDSEMKWFSIPGFNAIHIINAWEIGEDEIVLISSKVLDIENALHMIQNSRMSLHKLTINIQTGEVSIKTLSERNLDMGSINASYVGRKHRYAYIGIVERFPRMSGVVKIDLENEREVSTRFYEPGCFGSGEPLFVAKEGGIGDEDDGFLVNYVHNENSGESSFVVMDAKSPELQVVATVKMPRRIPYGFHGIFVNGENL